MPLEDKSAKAEEVREAFISDANLYSDAREKAEVRDAAAIGNDAEDPFDTIFKIFNNK